MNEGKATRYHRQRRRARLVATLGGVALLLAVLLSGGTVALRDGLRAWLTETPQSGGPLPWFAPACYAGVVWILVEVWLFPFRFYWQVILERRYRVSETPALSWLVTTLTTSWLNVALVAIAAVVVSMTRLWWPEVWWLACGALFSAATLVATTLAPVWILPRVSTIRPLKRPSLEDRLASLAARIGVPPIRVDELVLGRGRRGAHASLVGLGTSRRVLLSDTLLSDYSDAEIEAVTAHEMGHHVHRDLWQTASYELGLAFVALWTAGWVVTAIGAWFGVTGPTDLAALPLLALVGGGVVAMATPLGHALSRYHERRADHFALRYCSEPAALASSLRRLGEQHLAEERPSRAVELFWHSHPPLERRLAQLSRDAVARVSRTSPAGRRSPAYPAAPSG